LFLDYIRFFVLFETDGEKTIKKIAGYHQFHAVREAVQATIAAANPNGDKKAGVVWHTQGSGKSIHVLLCRQAFTAARYAQPNLVDRD
jgi:type I restriction enzyme R subunit